MEQLTAEQGDITTYAVDAIVNAANEALLPGGGVCGAIHRAAGPELKEACRRVAPCPTGEARITPGFALPAKWVIHAVGPVWRGGNAQEDFALAHCYRSVWQMAQLRGLQTVALPAIATGIYGFPFERATAIAVKTTKAALAERPQARAIFVCFGEEALEAYHAALAAA